MSSHKFGQVTVDSKQFYEVIEIGIKTLNVDNIVVSDFRSDDKKGKRYIIGYNIDNKIVALRIKTPENAYSYGVSKYTETSKLCMRFNLEGHDEWIEKYKKIWEAVEAQVFQSITTEVVNKGQYINPKLNMYGDRVALKFYGKDVPYGKHCEATGVLRIASIYNQGDNYWPQVYIDECRYKEVKNHGILYIYQINNIVTSFFFRIRDVKPLAQLVCRPHFLSYIEQKLFVMPLYAAARFKTHICILNEKKCCLFLFEK